MPTPAAPPSWWYREPPPFIGTVLQRLGESQGADTLLAREVGDGARDTQRPMDATRAHAAAIDGVGDQPARRGVQRAMRRERRVREPSVEGATGTLPLSRRQHALAHG